MNNSLNKANYLYTGDIIYGIILRETLWNGASLLIRLIFKFSQTNMHTHSLSFEAFILHRIYF